MIVSVESYIEDLKTILDNNLESYLDARSEDGYELYKPSFYLYEKKVFENYPSMVILTENITKDYSSRGAEVINASAIIYLFITGDEKKLAKLAYNYEACIRECIFDNRTYNDKYFIWDTSEFSLQVNVGSQIVKQITMRLNIKSQEVY